MSQILAFVKRSMQCPEVLPLIVVVSGALAGGGYMMFHEAQAPDVVWNHRTNPEPWQEVKEGDQFKLLAFNQHYDRKFHRKEW